MSLLNCFSQIRYDDGQYKLKNKSIIHGAGPDILEYLSKQVTSHVLKLDHNSFQESALTDNKGRLVSNFILIKENEHSAYIVVEKEFKEKTLKRLEQFHISEEFEFSSVNKDLFIAFGENLTKSKDTFNGFLFNRESYLSFSHLDNIPDYDENLFEDFIFLSGSPTMGEEITEGELITNTFLTEIAIDFKKGCYPGQETISKIHNNKGAAFFPVCLIGDEIINTKIVKIDDKKIGDIKKSKKIDNKFYHYTAINRANRILNKKIEIGGNEYTVKYFPLLDNSKKKRAIELYDKAVSSFHKGDDQIAIDLLLKAISIDKNFSDAYESLGVIYGRNREFEKAIEVMKKLSEVDPSSVMAHTNLSMYYMQLGDKETAEKHKAEATFKQFEVLGTEAQKKKAEEEAQKKAKADKEKRKEMFLQVLEIDDEDALANFGMGELLLEKNDFEHSAKHLEIAIKTDKKYSVAYLALAKSYIGLKEVEKAKTVLDEGIEIAVNNGDLMPANEMQSILNNL